MKTIKDNELFNVGESSLLIDLVTDRFIEIGEKETVKHLFMELIEKITNLTGGYNAK